MAMKQHVWFGAFFLLMSVSERIHPLSDMCVVYPSD